MHETQHLVTGIDVIDDNAKTINIDNVAQQALLLRHFLVNAVKMLLPADDFSLDTFSFQSLLQAFGNFLDDLALIALAFL